MSVALVGAGPAAAKSVRIGMGLTCSSRYPDVSITAEVESSAPDSVPVGQSIPPIPISAAATVPSYVTDALNFIGAKTITGTASATALVESADGEASVTVQLSLQETPVPGSGPLTIDASGSTPAQTFHQPGIAKVVFSRLDLSITPMNAGGEPTIAGTVAASCTLNSGASLLDEFQVTPLAGTSPSRTPGNAGPSGVVASGAVTTAARMSASSQSAARNTQSSTSSGSSTSASISTPSQTVSGSVSSIANDSQGAGSGVATSLDATSHAASYSGMDNTRLLLIVSVASATAFGCCAAFVWFKKRDTRRHEPGAR